VTRILCYHDVVSSAERERTGFPGPTSARYKLSPEEFERHLDALAANRARVGLIGTRADVALTFDDGGASALAIADALERRGYRGHFLIATVMVGTPGFMRPDQVCELAARGHEIGSHTHTHPPYIERLAPPTVAYEWRHSHERLGELLGRPPRLAAVPGGRLSETLVEQAALAGYELLLSCEPTLRARHHGELTVLGRYMIWGDTPAARAAA
jgi:peptidoglycan/xylan/chitin deacetylase (PgdA/CDA1 family)